MSCPGTHWPVVLLGEDARDAAVLEGVGEHPSRHVLQSNDHPTRKSWTTYTRADFEFDEDGVATLSLEAAHILAWGQIAPNAVQDAAVRLWYVGGGFISLPTFRSQSVHITVIGEKYTGRPQKIANCFVPPKVELGPQRILPDVSIPLA